MGLDIGHMTAVLEHDEGPVTAILGEPYELLQDCGLQLMSQAKRERHPVDGGQYRSLGGHPAGVLRDTKRSARGRDLAALLVMPAVWAATEGALLAPFPMTCDCDTPGDRAC